MVAPVLSTKLLNEPEAEIHIRLASLILNYQSDSKEMLINGTRRDIENNTSFQSFEAILNLKGE